MSSILIKNVQIFDVESGSHDHLDILVRDGIIHSIGKILTEKADQVIAEEGLYATAGWVDAHAHIFAHDPQLGVDPYRYHFCKGVTCVVDQGSAGADNYGEFKKSIKEVNFFPCHALLNCSKVGIQIESLSGAGEFSNPNNFDEDALIDCYSRYSKELLGIKIRLTPNVCPHNVDKLMEKAANMSKRLGVPLEVHPNFADMKDTELFGLLKRGDIYTHMYHNSPVGILDEEGNVKECVREARERGVIFDVAHGVSSLSFRVMNEALKQGFYPDIISTDLHNANIDGPVYDLATTMSKFLCAGLSMRDVLYKVTKAPVEYLHIPNKDWKIQVGRPADITLFALDTKHHVYQDAFGVDLEGNFRVIPKYTIFADTLYQNLDQEN